MCRCRAVKPDVEVLHPEVASAEHIEDDSEKDENDAERQPKKALPMNRLSMFMDPAGLEGRA